MARKTGSKRKMHLFDGLIKPEKRALFYAASLITAIALFHHSEMTDPQFALIAATGALMVWFLLLIISRSALLTGFYMRCLLTAMIGIAAASLQIILHPPQSLDRGITLATTGIVAAIDGAIDRRIRLWIALDRPYAVLSAGCLVFIGCRRRLYPLGVLMLALAGFLWWYLSVPQGVLFAKGQTQFLVMAGQHGSAYSHGTQNHRRLSSFFTDIAERQLTQPVKAASICKPFCAVYTADGQKITIVDRTFNLTKAFNSETDMILSLVPVRYPCRSDINIYDMTLHYGHNSVIYIDNNKSVYMSNNSGSSQQVCPVPQRHPC